MPSWRHTVKLGHMEKEITVFWFLLPQSVVVPLIFKNIFRCLFFFYVGYFNYWIAECVVSGTGQTAC